MIDGDSSSSPAPALSAILVVGGLRRRAARALHSLLRQETNVPFEIVVMDCGALAHPPLPGSADPRVRCHRVGPGLTFAELRRDAVLAARAPVVACIEEHCEAFPGWAQALIEAHAGPWGGVGCAFDNGNPEIGGSTLIFKNNYGEYLPHRSAGVTTWISGHNSSYKRQALLDLGADLRTLLMCDVVLHQVLIARGHQLYFEPRARISHLNEDSVVAFGWGIFAWNWCYSAVRIRAFGWSRPWRLLYLLGTPLIPAYRSLKILLGCARHGVRGLFQGLIDLPVTYYFNSCAALGQAAGLFLAHEDVERRFSFYEMHTSRTCARDFDP